VKGALFLAWLLMWLTWAQPSHAFTHIVKPGETLSQIAARVYGDARKETILAGANALDVLGGSAIVPGMRLEIPAPGHHTVIAGDTWSALALTWLGDTKRADVLARLNHGVSWVDPPAGLAVEIPAVIAHIAREGDTSGTVAARYWGDANRGWELNAFNGRHEAPFQRGEVVLVWLPGLELSEAGKGEAASSLARTLSETETARLLVQQRADAQIALLADDLQHGRYVAAIERGNQVLGSGPLTRPELAGVYRALLEGYAAVGDERAAVAACRAWHANDPGAHLDPSKTSPKLRAACSP